ncbi:uncharacterized protein EDB91DRAFT_1086592 [Suillus paluster]|uniref:uncharacterized protein n=1 Tax=Suillus paluster TaxID=48578 RepID=UPI001B8685D7|nr:uncharacterized protein EDB91DRAFT_1086592 [Suillus paluster]KAG1726977.1 hypothetical protein EDB91DRAFT_1086592 [Suillus paluster]
MSQDSCALNASGSLKDTSEIKFYNNPDDNVPLPQVPSAASMTNTFSILLKAGHVPATVAAGSRCSGHPTKPPAHVRDAYNACSLSSGTRKHACALSSAAADPLAPKKVAMQFLSPLDSDDEDDEVVPSSPPDLDEPGEPSSDEPIPQPDDDKADEAQSESGDTTQTVGLQPVQNRLAVGWMTLDNTSNNDTAMREIGRVINEDDKDGNWLATILKKIRHAIDCGEDADVDSLTEQLTALEHDPEAIVEDGFDVGDAVRKALALIEQIRKSPQAQAFFRKSCEEEGVAVRKILTWVRTCWASLFKCLEHFLSLDLAVNRFTLLADKSHKEPVTAQQSFSSVAYPTAWQTIPILECLTNTWQTMVGNLEYALIVDTIRKGLKNIDKYYQKASDSDIYFICLVLDPNYKLAYVECQWTEMKVVSGRARLEAVFDKYYEALPGPGLHVKEPMAMLTTKGSIPYVYATYHEPRSTGSVTVVLCAYPLLVVHPMGIFFLQLQPSSTYIKSFHGKDQTGICQNINIRECRLPKYPVPRNTQGLCSPEQAPYQPGGLELQEKNSHGVNHQERYSTVNDIGHSRR